jgi:hypothetical protein
MAECTTTTPRTFGVYSFTDKTAEAVGVLSGVVNAELKQVLMRGSVGAPNAYHNFGILVVFWKK